jgi:RNA polymerase sigma factor (sigma-70 family)
VASDPVLLPFLRAQGAEEARLRLGELIAREADPLVGSVVRRRLGASPEAEDVRGQVRLRLIQTLEELRRNAEAGPILDFRGYVATVTAHACDDALRRKYPQRLRLRNQLRYLLSHDPAFTLERVADGRWLCGLDGRTRGRTVAGAAAGLWFSDPRAYLRGVLAEAEGQLDLDDLVAIVGEAAGLSTAPAAAPLPETLAAPDSAMGERLDQQRFLERLWREIVTLPLRQRTALLLNLRDPGVPDVIAVLPLTGTASLRQIAAALEMTAEELAALWNELPLNDQAIAARLGLKRQQVINLRASARARLARRLLGLGRHIS